MDRGMPAHSRFLVLAAILAAVSWTQAQEHGKRIFIPIDDLDVVFDQHGPGVLLPRDEYQKLSDAAQKNREGQPKSAVVSSATYTGKLEGEHLVLQGAIDYHQFRPQWEAIGLPFENVSIETAQVDDKPARLGPGPQLFTREPGRHTLKLDLSAKLVNVGSDQVTSFKLPPIGVASLTLPVPAGKFLHVDEVALERPAPADQPASYTVALGGRREVSLRITDQQAEQATKSLVFANMGLGVHVAPEEVSWQAVANLQVFGQSVDTLEFLVPRTLEIVSVESTGLERWEIADGPNGETTLLKLTYRQPFRDSRAVTFRGVQTTKVGEPWTVPTLTLQQATSQTASILVQHPASLRVSVLDVQGARRIGTEELKADMPDMAQVASRQQLHFAAWKPDFQIQIVTQAKERELQASLATKLDLNVREITLVSSLMVRPRFAPLFGVSLSIPADWSPTEVLVADQPVPWQVAPGEAGVNRVRVPFASPLPPDGMLSIQLNARRIASEDWPPSDVAPEEGQPAASIEIPEVRLEESSVTEGTYQIAADEEFELVVADLTGLDPIPVSEADLQSPRPPRLAYEYQDTRFSGALHVSRKPTRQAALILGFHRLEQRTVVSHLEARLVVEGSGIRTIPLFLSESAGEALRFRLVNSPARIVEQIPAEPMNGRRLWTLQLDQRTAGLLHLIVDLEVPRTAEAQITLPALRIGTADRHDVYLAVEGHPDQQLTIDAKDAAGQNLTPFDPPDLPAPVGYLPQQRIVAAYRTVDADAELKVTDSRFDRVAVPTAICDRCELVSVLGDAGDIQHEAVFHLRAVGVQSLNLRLPESATLWATTLDGTPIEVRKQSGSVYAVPLTGADGAARTRVLKLVYGDQGAALGLNGRINQEPPLITALSGQGTAQPVEILSRTWTVHAPDHAAIIASHGAFQPDEEPTADSLLGELLKLIRFPTGQSLNEKLIALAVALVVVVVLRQGFVVLRRMSPTMRIFTLFAGVALVGLGVVCLVGFVFIAGQPLAMAPSTSVSQRWDTSDGAVSYTAAPATVIESEMTVESTDQVGTFNEQGNYAATETASEKSAAPQEEAEYARDKAEAMQKSEQEIVKSMSKVIEQSERAKEAIIGGSKPDDPFATEAPSPARMPEEAPPANAEPNQPASRPLAGPQDQPPQDGQPAAPPIGQPAGMDPQEPKPEAEVAGRGPEAGKAITGALLSLNFEVARPAGYPARVFTYKGSAKASPNLEFEYQDRSSLDVLRAVAGMFIVLVCWWLRRAPLVMRGAFGALGLAIPLGLTTVVPPVVLPVLDGVFLGTVVGIGLWLVTSSLSRLWEELNPPKKGILTSLLLLVALASPAFAQEKPATPPPEPKPVPIVIPYDAATDPLKAERVLLPYDKFLELWNAANPDKPKLTNAIVEGVVAEALYSAKYIPAAAPAPAQVEVTARYAVHNLREGQITLPLPIAAVPFATAKLDGQSAPIIEIDGDSGKVPAIVLGTTGPHVVDVTFKLPAEQTGEAGRFSLPLKAVPAGSLRFTLPAKDLSLRVTGASGTFRQVTQNNEAVAIVPVAEGGNVTVSWAPTRVRDAVDGIIQVDSVTAVNVTDAGVLLTAGYKYVVRQGSISEATFTVPQGVQIKRISGPDVGGWTPPGDEEPRILTVTFRRSVTDSTQLVFELFSPLDVADESATFTVPQFAPTGVTRETGTVAVYAEGHLSVAPGQIAGLSQIDPGQFAAVVDIPRPQTAPLFVYRHVSRPFTLPLSISRQKPVSKGVAEHAIVVTPRKVRVKSRFDLTLTGAPRSEILLQPPDGYLLADVTSPDIGDWSVQQSNPLVPPLLRLEMVTPRTGRVEFLLDGTILREPTEEATVLMVPTPLDVQDLRTSAAVWIDSLYTPSLTAFEPWKSVDPQTLPAKLRAAKAELVQFAFTANTPDLGAIELALTQATPAVSADTLTAVIVGETQVEYVLALQWKIERAAETRFTFTAPDWLSGPLDIHRGSGPGRIRQVLSQKLADGRTRWTLYTEEPQRERYFVTARAVVAPPKLAAAPAVTALNAPAIIVEQKPTAEGDPQPVATQRSYLMLVNQSPWQIDPADPNLMESVPADELPITVRQAWLDQAGEVLRLKSPTDAGSWTARPVQTLQALAASVNLMDITLVLSEDGSFRGKLLLKVNNRARQFLGLRMPAGTKILSLYVQGQPARPASAKVGTDNAVLIPMPKTAAGDLAAEVQLVYEGRYPRDLPEKPQLNYSPFKLAVPKVYSQTESPQFGAPVSRTEWTVLLPDDLEPILWDSQSNMTASVAGVEEVISGLSELNEMLANFRNFNYEAKSRAKYNVKNNLKQLGLAVNRSDFSNLSESKRNELDALQRKVQEAERELEVAEQVEQQQAAQQPVERLEDTLQLDNRNSDLFDGKEADEVQFGLEGVSEGEGKDVAEGTIMRGAQTRAKRGELRESSKGQAAAINANQPAIQSGIQSPPIPPGDMQHSGRIPIYAQPGEERPYTLEAGSRSSSFDGRSGSVKSLFAGGRKLGDIAGQPQAGEGAQQGRHLMPFEFQGEINVDQDGDRDDLVLFATLSYSQGGLSLPIDLPQQPQSLTFSKVGGDPELVIGLRPRKSLDLAFGFVWTVLWLALAVAAIAAFRTRAVAAALAGRLPVALAALGFVWFFAFPLPWLGFALLLTAGLVAAWQSTLRTA